jgi:hypothetical protein
MKFLIMVLALFLVTIIGTATGYYYSEGELYNVLPQCGLNYYVDDCKCTTPSTIDFK